MAYLLTRPLAEFRRGSADRLWLISARASRRIAAALARHFNQVCVTLSADSVADADLMPLQFAVLAYLNKRDGQPRIDRNALRGYDELPQ